MHVDTKLAYDKEKIYLSPNIRFFRAAGLSADLVHACVF